MVELNMKALPVKELQLLSSSIEFNVKIYNNYLKFTIVEQLMLATRFGLLDFLYHFIKCFIRGSKLLVRSLEVKLAKTLVDARTTQ